MGGVNISSGLGASLAGAAFGGSALGLLNGQGGLISSIHGSAGNSGILGTGQYKTDPYAASAQAFAPDANEQAFIQQLQGYANGSAPSAAQLQMQQGMNQAIQQSQALAASQRGINPALAARLAAQSQANLAQQTNANSAILRAQEQEQGMGMLGNELQSVRKGREDYQNLQSGNYNSAMGANEKGYEAAAKTRSGMFGGAMNALGGALGMAEGGKVPGKAPVKGNSPKNDKVDAKLSPGEIVLPRSVTESKDPGEMAKEFVNQIKRSKKSKEDGPSFAKVLEMHRDMGEALKLCMGGKVK